MDVAQSVHEAAALIDEAGDDFCLVEFVALHFAVMNRAVAQDRLGEFLQIVDPTHSYHGIPAVM